MKCIFLSTWMIVAGLSAACQSAKRPVITGVAFARFYTSDPVAAEKFYGKTLGYEGRDVNGTTVYPVNRSQWIEVLPGKPPEGHAQMAAVGFTTSDAEAMARYLVSRGVAVAQPLKDGELGVRDPEGNLVIFVQAGSRKAVASAPVSPSAISTRLMHTGFVVRDEAKENTFWVDVLGFRPYWHGGKTDDRTDWVMQQVPEGSDWVEYMLNLDAVLTPRQMGNADHISLGVARIPDAVTALARNQCEGANCTKTQVGRDGKTQLNLTDPDATRVEVMEFAPVREPCCSAYTAKHPVAE